MRNTLKIRVLAALDGRGWLNAAMIAGLTGFRPKRAIYIYLARLQRWGLVRRRSSRRGLLLYSISDRGRTRLTWLREHSQ
jgi:DNA-binding IclR family transcriptional regulator